MKVQNWKSRRTTSSLLAASLLTMGFSALTPAAAIGATTTTSRPTSAPSRPAAPVSRPAPPPAPRPAPVAPAPRPAPAAPAPAPNFGSNSNYYKPNPVTVTPQPAPAQKSTPTTPSVPNFNPQSNPYNQRPATVTTPAQQQQQQPSRQERSQTQQVPTTPSIPNFNPQPNPYNQRPVTVTPSTQQQSRTQAPPTVNMQTKVNPMRSSIPVIGLPQASSDTNTAPISTYNGKSYQTVQKTGDGKVVVENKITGKKTNYDSSTGRGTTQNKSGTATNNFRVADDGYKYNSVTFTGANGAKRTKDFKTRPVPVETSNGTSRMSEHYVRTFPTPIYSQSSMSTMDYMLIWMLLNQHNQSSYGGGYSGGNSSSAGYGGSGVPSLPPPPKIASGFEISWPKQFEVVPPEYLGSGTMTYTTPADAVAAYVTLDIINENSEIPGFWKKLLLKIGIGEPSKPYQMDAAARSPLTQQVTRMAAQMITTQEVSLDSVIDPKTGELVKDANGDTKPYYFVVDPQNAMQVKDTDTDLKCDLPVAAILRPIEAVVSGDLRFMRMKIVGGSKKEGSCRTGQQILIDQADLEEMNNSLAAKVDSAIHAIPTMSKPVYK